MAVENTSELAGLTTSERRSQSSRNRNRGKQKGAGGSANQGKGQNPTSADVVNNAGMKNSNTGTQPSSSSRPIVSNPEIEVKFKLNTSPAIRFQRRSFNTASQALFNLSNNSLHLERLGVAGVVEKSNAAILEMFAEPEKEISNGLKVWNELLKEAASKLEIHHTSYSAPQEFEYNLRTPTALRLTKLIQKYDELNKLIDTLWLNDMVHQGEVDEYRDQVNGTLRNFIGKLEQYAKTTVDELNERRGVSSGGNPKSEESRADVPHNNESDSSEVKEAEIAQPSSVAPQTA